MSNIEFSYTPGTPVGGVRLLAGDIDPEGLNRTGGDRTRTDTEIEQLLGMSAGETRLAAAALLEGKAAEFASTATLVAQSTLRQDFRERSRRLLEAAAVLRNGAVMPSWSPASYPEDLGEIRED